jgi:hypothetical protein
MGLAHMGGQLQTGFQSLQVPCWGRPGMSWVQKWCHLLTVTKSHSDTASSCHLVDYGVMKGTGVRAFEGSSKGHSLISAS